MTTASPAAARTPKGSRQWKALLDTSARMFADRGYAGTSITDIAADVGLIKASLYHYVSSKDDLLAAVIDGLHDRFRQNLADSLVASGHPYSVFARFVAGHVSIAMSDPARAKVYMRDRERLSPDRLRGVVEFRASYEGQLTRLAHAMADDAGAQRPHESEVAAVLVMLDAAPEWCRLGDAETDEGVIARVCELAARALIGVLPADRSAPADGPPPALARPTKGTPPVQIDQTVAEALEAAYAEFADRPALRDMNGTTLLRYDELGARARSVAASLLELGALPGSPVVIISDNRSSFFEVEHGIFLAGCVRVALGDRLHVSEVVRILNDCRAPVVVADGQWATVLHRERPSLPHLLNLIVWGEVEDRPSGVIGIERLVERPLPDFVTPVRSPSDIAALLYTSGSTGDPKGVQLSNSAWLAMARMIASQLPPFGDEDTMLHIAPLSHMSGYHALPVFEHGGSHIVSRRFDAAGALEAIERCRITSTALVPTILNRLAAQQRTSRVDMSSLKTVIYGGARISAGQLRAAVEVFGTRLRQFYGLSEIPILSCLGAREHDPAGVDSGRYLSSAGRVLPEVELKVVSPEGTTLPVGETGEIVARSPTAMVGYLNRPNETREACLAGGWVRTGDVGEIDEDGYLYIRDRLKDVVISGGYNIYTSEVENVVVTFPGVLDVAVVGVPDETWGEMIVAAVVPENGVVLDEDELAHFCSQRIARYKVPKKFWFVESLPLSSARKIDRKTLVHRFGEEFSSR